MLFAGIDWADDHHDIDVLGPDGKPLDTFQVAHTADGLSHLVNRLRGLHRGGQDHDIACIIETRHGLLITTLLEAGFTVYPVNPKTVDRRRKPSGAKTDAIDARILSRHGYKELDELRPLEPDNPIIAELKELTRDQVLLIHQQTRLVNQLTACLKGYYPLALEFFSKLQQPVTLAFLQAYPTLEAVCAADPDEIATLLRRYRHPRRNQAAQRIVARAQKPQLQANPMTTRAKARLMLAFVAQLAPLVDAIRAYDEAIQELFTAHSDSGFFQSLPGAGKRLAPRLLAEWGDDRSRYTSHESVGALAGTSAVPRKSGRNQWRACKRFACVKPFRKAMYDFAWASTRTEAWALAYYKRKRRQGKSHSVTVRALSNVWVRIIFAIWQNRQTYDPQRFLAAQEAHAPQAA